MSDKHSSIAVFILGALAALAVLLAGAWAFRFPLAESLLQSKLATLGFPAIEVEIVALTPWQASLRNAHLTEYLQVQRIDAEIQWPTLFKPRLARLVFIKPSVEVGITPLVLDWRELEQFIKRREAAEIKLDFNEVSELPIVELQDLSATILDAGGSSIAEIAGASLSLLTEPNRERTESTTGTKRLVNVVADVSISHFRSHRWEARGLVLNMVGFIERDQAGRLNYSPEYCDRLSATALRKDNFSFSGPISICVKPSDQGFAVSVASVSDLTVAINAKLESEFLNVAVARLPPTLFETNGASLLVHLAQRSNGVPSWQFTLQATTLFMHTSNIAVEDIRLSLSHSKDPKHSNTWSLDFAANALRHRAINQIVAPVSVEGVGTISPDRLTISTRLRQPASELEAVIWLQRDNHSGEGEAEIRIGPIEFQESGPDIGDLSPVLAQYLSHLSGGIEMAGRISFNDAWVTPIDIDASLSELVVGLNQSYLPAAQNTFLVDFGQAKVHASLPPASPNQSHANIKIADGALRLGSAYVSGLRGEISIDSLQPLVCRRRQGMGHAERKPGRATYIVDCTLGALKPADSEQSLTALREDLTELIRHLSSAPP